MDNEQVKDLLSAMHVTVGCVSAELIETHISWVIMCDQFVYKIKKPLRYSFLDFSTLPMRKHFCEKEVELNSKLTDNVYLDVQPVKKSLQALSIGGKDGETIDYAVRMRKLPRQKQMDKLLVNGQVTEQDIQNLAKKIASFHKTTEVIYKKDVLDVQSLFNDLETQIPFLTAHLRADCDTIIRTALDASNRFLEASKDLLASRLAAGFFRNCHGDLHAKNIFLLPSPQPFDRIEFNDDYRHIDVLNDVAFLCMDLDAFGRRDLSDAFLQFYNIAFPSMDNSDDRRLFVYYKAYRANIRAKVNSLRAGSAANNSIMASSLNEADKYLSLMISYLKLLET